MAKEKKEQKQEKKQEQKQEQPQATITPRQIAEELGVTPFQVRVFLRSGQIFDGKFADGKYTRYKFTEEEARQVKEGFIAYTAAKEQKKAQKAQKEA